MIIFVYILLNIQAQTLLCSIEIFNIHSYNRKNYVYEHILRVSAECDVDKNVSDFCQDGNLYPSLLTNVLNFLVEYALWLHCLQVFKHDQRLKFYNAFKYYFQLCKFHCSICPLWQQNIQGFRYMTPRKPGVSAKLVEAGSLLRTYSHCRNLKTSYCIMMN